MRLETRFSFTVEKSPGGDATFSLSHATGILDDLSFSFSFFSLVDGVVMDMLERGDQGEEISMSLETSDALRAATEGEGGCATLAAFPGTRMHQEVHHS